MDEKTKLYVFDKKEVILIFLFLVIVALVSFLLGLRFGKSVALKTHGYTQSDIQRVGLMSDQEEKIVDEIQNINKENLAKKKLKSRQELDERYMKGLQKELLQLQKNTDGAGNVKGGLKQVKSEAAQVEVAQTSKSEMKKNKQETKSKKVVKSETKNDLGMKVESKADFLGKFTIQLGSHKSLKDAQEFADAFVIRGYDPIINEVKLRERGVWYRVSLGIFESVKEAKKYVKKEESLFQGQDYVITDVK